MPGQYGFSNINWIPIFTFIFFLSSPAISQDSPDGKAIEIRVEAGVSFQYFGLESFLLKPENPRIQPNAFLSIGKVNAIGFGVPVGVNVYSSKMRLGLKSEVTLRYDVTSPEFFTRSGINKARYGIFTDYHFSIFRNFKILFPTIHASELRSNKLELRLGIGYSFLSAWQSYNYHWEEYDTQTGRIITGNEVDLSFSGISVSLGLKPLKSIGSEVSLIHVKRDKLLYNYFQSANLIIVKVYYQIPLKPSTP